jgi:DNA repair protein RadC
MSKYNMLPSQAITTSNDCTEVFRKAWKNIDRQERSYVMYMNQNNNLIAIKNICKGNHCATVFDFKETLRHALRLNAKKITMAHNHTNGDMTPTKEDIEVTTKMVSLCLDMGMSLRDHIILSGDDYYSFRDAGLLV